MAASMSPAAAMTRSRCSARDCSSRPAKYSAFASIRNRTFRNSSTTNDKVVRGQRIAAHPARNRAEPAERDEVRPERSGNRCRLLRAKRRQLARRGKQRPDLPKPDDFSADPACGRNANGEIHDVARRRHPQQHRPERRHGQRRHDQPGPQREDDVPWPPGECVRPDEPVNVVARRRVEPGQHGLRPLSSIRIAGHTGDERVEGLEGSRLRRRPQPVVEHLLADAAFCPVQVREHVVQKEVVPRPVVQRYACRGVRSKQVRHGVHVSPAVARVAPLGAKPGPATGFDAYQDDHAESTAAASRNPSSAGSTGAIMPAPV